MGNSIRVGKILDFEIRLDYSWFLVFFLVAWNLSVVLFPSEYRFGPELSWVLGITAALLLFASVLIHEISHALMARHYGIEVQGITLFLFGGVAQIKGEPGSPKQEFMIAGVGPLTSVGLGVFFLGMAWVVGTLTGLYPAAVLFNYLGWINLLLAVFNMIPGFPMDGGRILRSAVWKVTGDLEKATRWASFAGRGFAWLLIGAGLVTVFRAWPRMDLGGFWLVFIGWFLNNAAQGAYQQVLVRQALTALPVTDAMARDLPAVDAELRVRDFVHQYLMRYDARLFPVLRDGEFIGVVTMEDVRKLDQQYWGVTSVGTIAQAREQDPAVDASQSSWEALTEMAESQSPRLLVFGDGKLKGIVTQESLSRLIQRSLHLGLRRGRASSGRLERPSRTRGLAP